MAFTFANHAGRAVLISGNSFHDLETLSGGKIPADPMSALAHEDLLHELQKQTVGRTPEGTVDASQLGAPSPAPQKVFGIGLNYKTHADNNSLYNTPNTFGIYVLGLTIGWLKGLGGLHAVAAMNERKARLLYDEIDRTGFYRGTAQRESRSLMNVTFRLPSEDLEKKFDKEATAAGLDGLKGHRSVGGMRASIYNAFPEAGIDALVSFMQEFEKKNG